MRRSLACFAVVTLVGCAAAPASIHRTDVEQFVISVDACIPDWFGAKPTLSGQSIIQTARAIASGERRGLFAEVECVVAAGGDCARVRDCYGLRVEGTTGPCNGAPPRCEGDTLVQCIPTNGFAPTQVGRVDCAHQGLECLEAGGRAACALGLCDATFLLRCEGDALVECDGLFERPTAPPPNMACREPFSGFATFMSVGAECEQTECIDQRAIVCDADTHVVTDDVDCASIGRVCREVPATVVCDTPPGAECTGALAVCIGSVVRFCGSDQRLHDYDCSAHGFAGCDLHTSPFFTDLAGCVPAGPRF